MNGSYRQVEHSSDNFSEKILDKKPKMHRSVSQKDWKNDIFAGIIFPAKFSSSRVKHSFDIPVEILSRENWKFFAQALKLAKNDF